MKILTASLVAAMCALLSVTAAAQDDIQNLAHKWAEAYNSLDQDKLEALYTEDATLYLHGSPMIMGRDQIGSFWAADFLEGNPLTVLTVTNSVEGFDMMLVHGNYQVIDKESGSILGHGRFAHIWHDVDGEWLLDQDLWNQPASM